MIVTLAILMGTSLGNALNLVEEVLRSSAI